MLRSLILYAKNFGVTILARKERKFLWQGFSVTSKIKSRNWEKAYIPTPTEALKEAVQWLETSHHAMHDKGFGTYYIRKGWSSSYPETSGYILPTLHEGDALLKQDHSEMIIQCADWLISIQKESGGWQSGYVAENKKEVVFNTGQVIRGLLTAYQISGEKKYLTSAEKACDWLASIQSEDGSWQQFAFMHQQRVYDSYVDHPMLEVWKINGNETYREAAVKNLDWIIETQQEANGWFRNCDNTIKHNDRPILHTISYTIDGLLNSGKILQEEKYIQAGKKAADALLEIFSRTGYLHGRFDRHWKGCEYSICTGLAQISICWWTLFELYSEEKYAEAGRNMNRLLRWIQHRNFAETKNTKGAIPGSLPVWGKYESFGFPNWATKYFADAMMKEVKS